MRRVFVEGAEPNAALRLSDAEAHHARSVLRLRSGETVLVMDGEGRSFEARLRIDENGAVWADTGSETAAGAELPRRVILYQAVIKGDHFDYAVQKSVEAGVASVVPFLSERCIKVPGNPARFQQRANRIALEAAKQCGRNVAPAVQAIVPFDDVVREAGAMNAVVAYEQEKSLSFRKYLCGLPDGPLALIVGPEGGFTDAEISALREGGVRSVTLGPRILRSETAGPHMLAQISYDLEL